jgi:hypothetical protein
MATTINPSDQTITQYALQVGAASNLLGGISAVATGQVLASGGVSANPAFTASPTVTSITFGAGTALSTYAEGTFTPTISGASTAGTTTYSGSPQGTYRKIGNIVYFNLAVSWTNATGTGVVQVGGLPFTAKSGIGYMPVYIYSTTFLIATATYFFPIVVPNTTTVQIYGGIVSTGSQVSSSLASNTSATIYLNGCYCT